MDASPTIFDDAIPVGTTFPPCEFILEPERVRHYAAAVEADNPLYHQAAVEASGPHPGAVAPPTIAAIYVRHAYSKAASPIPGTVHARQAYRFHRPQRAGDRLTLTATLVERYVRKERIYVVIRTVATNQHGELVTEATNTVFLPHKKAT
ncbi:MAG: MaoC family dehydratase N-terminal domain-containing protein [Candidatus Tectomicrobia bacterium]|nr:MaoC family dehydratase N-terminal domain-containing protein [Candidatus Tectomicrobia bacterium]